jgi:predicted nucleic acid-binding protein
VIVVDASALAEVLLRRPAAAAVERRLFDTAETLHAPHLIDIELAHVVRRFNALGALDGERGSQVLKDLTDLSLMRYPHSFLLPRIWELCANLTAYDAAYVALAEILDATLLTCDRRLAAAAGQNVRVELV